REAVLGRRIASDAPDHGGVAAGRVQRGRQVGQLDTGRGEEQLAGRLRAELALELGGDRQRVAGEDRDPYTGGRDREVGQLEDLAGLVAELLLLVGLLGAVVHDGPGEGDEIGRAHV